MAPLPMSLVRPRSPSASGYTRPSHRRTPPTARSNWQRPQSTGRVHPEVSAVKLLTRAVERARSQPHLSASLVLCGARARVRRFSSGSGGARRRAAMPGDLLREGCQCARRGLAAGGAMGGRSSFRLAPSHARKPILHSRLEYLAHLVSHEQNLKLQNSPFCASA